MNAGSPQSGGPIHWWTAQGLHLVLGALVVTTAVLAGYPWWYGAVGILAVGAVKETLIDPLPSFEGNPFWNGTWNDGAVDFSFYVLGVGLGVLLLLLTRRPLP